MKQTGNQVLKQLLSEMKWDLSYSRPAECTEAISKNNECLKLVWL